MFGQERGPFLVARLQGCETTPRMDAASTSTIRRAMRKVEDVILLRRKKACRLAGHSDHSVTNSTSYAMTFELVDSADTFCLQSGRVTLVKSSTRGAVCTLAYLVANGCVHGTCLSSHFRSSGKRIRLHGDTSLLLATGSGSILIRGRGVTSVRAGAPTNFYPCRMQSPCTSCCMRARRTGKPPLRTRPIFQERSRRGDPRPLRARRPLVMICPLPDPANDAAPELQGAAGLSEAPAGISPCSR